MSNGKNAKAPLNKAIGTCILTEYFADRMFDEKIDVPEGLSLRIEIRDSVCWRIYGRHPICEFYGTFANWREAGRHSSQKYDRREDKILSEIFAMTPADLRSFASDARRSVRNHMGIASLDLAFKITDAHETMDANLAETLKYDEKGDRLSEVGFDEVFLRRAEEAGIYQEELEHIFAREIENIRQYQNTIANKPYYRPTPQISIMDVVRQGFSNVHVSELQEKFNLRYANMNILCDPIFRKLPPFAGYIWGKKPLTTDMILGNWCYKSSPTPTMLSRTKIPESMRIGYKGKPVNVLTDTPVFGESQNIIHIAELKNGKTSITMTPETRAFQGSAKKAA